MHRSASASKCVWASADCAPDSDQIDVIGQRQGPRIAIISEVGELQYSKLSLRTTKEHRHRHAAVRNFQRELHSTAVFVLLLDTMASLISTVSGNIDDAHIEEQLCEASGPAVLLHARPRSGSKRHIQCFADRIPVHLLEEVVDHCDRRLVCFLRKTMALSCASIILHTEFQRCIQVHGVLCTSATAAHRADLEDHDVERCRVAQRPRASLQSP